MAGAHAVIWSSDVGRGAGRLELRDDRLELSGRNRRLSIAFSELTAVSIGRDRADRLLGMPVLVLARAVDTTVRIAALEGPGLLYELAEQIEHARARPQSYASESGT
jgi:hypothetical protein